MQPFHRMLAVVVTVAVMMMAVATICRQNVQNPSDTLKQIFFFLLLRRRRVWVCHLTSTGDKVLSMAGVLIYTYIILDILLTILKNFSEKMKKKKKTKRLHLADGKERMKCWKL